MFISSFDFFVTFPYLVVNSFKIFVPFVPFEDSAEGFMKYVDQDPELSIKMGVTFDK